MVSSTLDAQLAPAASPGWWGRSGLVSSEEFDEVVVASLKEAGRTATVLSRLGAGPDHPFRPRAGGGEYLKGLLLTFLD